MNSYRRPIQAVHPIDGVPWREKSDTILYRPALSARYRAVTEGLGIIAIEASPRKADNDWLLKTAQDNPLIVGVGGYLVLPSITKPLKV